MAPACMYLHVTWNGASVYAVILLLGVLIYCNQIQGLDLCMYGQPMLSGASPISCFQNSACHVLHIHVVPWPILPQIGGPYQYGVQLFAKALWQMRFLGLMALNKVLPSIFHPPIMIMVQKSDLAYSEILRRAEESARRVKALAAALVALVVAVALRV